VIHRFYALDDLTTTVSDILDSFGIVNGAVRDAGAIRELGYPVWSCGVTPMTEKFRIEAIEMNGPVGRVGGELDG